MASAFMGFSKVSLLLILFSSLQLFTAFSSEFEVGDDAAWAIPKKNDEMYNLWASKNRFKVDDTIHFKYKKDSVLVVTEEEYQKCRSAHPLFFSNNGDTDFRLDRPGLFYFISGVAGHCERGQKMIIKVLEPENPPQSADQNTTSTDTSNGHGLRALAVPAACASVMFLFMPFLGWF